MHSGREGVGPPASSTKSPPCRPPVTVRYFYCTACHSATCNKNTRTIFRYRLMLWRTTKTKRHRGRESFSTRNYIESVHVLLLLLRNVNFIYFKATLDERRSQVKPGRRRRRSASINTPIVHINAMQLHALAGGRTDRLTDSMNECRITTLTTVGPLLGHD